MNEFDQEFPENVAADNLEETPKETVAITAEEPLSPDCPSEDAAQESVTPAAPEPVLAVPTPVAPEPVMSAPVVKKAKSKKEPKMVSLRAFVATILVFSVLFACCAGALYQLNIYWKEQLDDAVAECKEDLIAGMIYVMEKIPDSQNTSTDGVNLAPSQVFNLNVNAVVSIECELRSSGFFGGMAGYSSGSGFIYTQDGYILTNAHVVDGASSISVVTYSGVEYPATLIGADALMDVAVLKIDAEGLPFVTIGKSSDVIVGEQVAAIGNALGSLGFSLSVGYVSAKDRPVSTESTSTNMLQTDLSINSGNSGGPLFNMAGQVVGITSAKYSGTSSSGATIEGISFSIPIDDVMALLPELLETGSVSYAYLGVSVQDVAANAETGAPAGARVVETFDGFAAQKAGILADDIIVKLDKYDIANMNSLTFALRTFKPGDRIDVVVYRGGSQVTIQVVLDERPAE